MSWVNFLSIQPILLNGQLYCNELNIALSDNYEFLILKGYVQHLGHIVLSGMLL